MEDQLGASDAPGLPSLKYLTVQDMLWINLQVTGKVHHFNFAKLEESTYYQYGYGTSRDLARQAGRFLSGFLKLRPFDAGNRATALVGCAAFLKMNGKALDLPDEGAGGYLGKIVAGETRPEESLPVKDCGHGGIPEVHDAVFAVMEKYGRSIESLRTPAGAKAS